MRPLFVVAVVLALAQFQWRISCAQSALLSDISTSYSYDEFGNVQSVSRQTGDGYVDVQTIRYRANTARWLVAIPDLSTTSSSVPSGEAGSRSVQYVVDSDTGALLQRIIEPTGDESTFNRLTLLLDPHGVVRRFRSTDLLDSAHRDLTLQYDAAEDINPVSIANSLGQTELFAVHPGLGVVAANVDVNGVVESRQYDGFGRLKARNPPDGDAVSLAYTDPDPLGTSHGLQVAATYASGRTRTVVSDPQSRLIESQLGAFDGRTTVTQMSYDGRGLMTHRSGPCFSSAASCLPAATDYLYDELGRITSVRFSDGANKTWRYSGLTTHTYDEDGHEQIVVKDQESHILSSTAVTNDGRQIQATFVYEPFDLLKSITDPYENVVSAVHDTRDRPRIVTDPDSGTHIYSWNSFGELVGTQDANGIVTSIVRDDLGRIMTIDNRDGTTVFDWDSAANGIGKLADTTSPDSVVTTFTYDTLGRPASSSWTIAGSTDTIRYSYDAQGRLDTLTYPGGFQAQRKYNPHGFLYAVDRLPEGTALWSIDSENELGQVIGEHFPNGSNTARMFDAHGRVIDIAISNAGGELAHSAYQYTANGSLACRTDALPAQLIVEKFAYDNLDRLTGWNAFAETPDSQDPCLPPPTASSLSSQHFVIDDIGNLKQRIVLSGPGATRTYQYGQNSAGPHAVTQVDNDIYGYDPGGNQVAAPNRAIKFNAANLPQNIATAEGAVSFSYDADRARASRSSSGGDVTVYVGGLFERRTIGGQVSSVLYVPGLNAPVAQLQYANGAASPTTLFLAVDANGSIRLATDESGAAAAQRWYEPFGQLTNPANPSATQPPPSDAIRLGFKGQYEDFDLALINSVGRIYDPKLGRFLTPDALIQDPLNTESLNPYSYAWNNPFKWSDPSGFQNAGGSDPGSQGGGEGSGGSGNLMWGGMLCLPACPSSEGPVSVDDSGVSTGSNGEAQASYAGVWGLPQLACDVCAGDFNFSSNAVAGDQNGASGAPNAAGGLTAPSGGGAVWDQIKDDAQFAWTVAQQIPGTLFLSSEERSANIQAAFAHDEAVFHGNPSAAAIATEKAHSVMYFAQQVGNLASAGILMGAGQIVGKGVGAGSPAASTTTELSVPEGSFSIIDWTGYPEGVPKPEGPFRLLEGAEYDAARAAADRANTQLRRGGLRLTNQTGAYEGMQFHELQPVKFGGSPADPANKILLPKDLHTELTDWWRGLQLHLQ